MTDKESHSYSSGWQAGYADGYPAGYADGRRVSKLRLKNAVGKPYGEQYDPKYRIKTPLTSIRRLRKPWIVPPPYVGDASDGRHVRAV
jgi:hypothetical protein